MNSKRLVGVWLDHRQARLFWANGNGITTKQELSSGYQENGEPVDMMERSGATAHGGGVAHASLDRRRREQLKHYYKKLDKILRSADQIFLFGPGQAKRELASVLEDDKGLRARLRGVESADKKLTEPQMAARVRDFFDLSPAAI